MRNFLIKHPQNLWMLLFGEIWNTFSYYGTQTIIVLYCLHIFHLQRDSSYLIYGAYAGFAYTLPIVGGALADKAIGSRNALVIGCVLNIIGNLMLMSFHRVIFSFGIATALLGSGLYKSSATYLVGSLYQPGAAKKESGFILLYIAINIGGMLGPIVYGFLIYAAGWNIGFLCAALGIFIGMIWLLFNWKTWQHEGSAYLNVKNQMWVGCFMIVVIFLLGISFYNPQIIHFVIPLLFLISIVYLVGMILKYQGVARRHLFGLLVISFFGMFYFAASLQIGTTITLFIQQKINQGIINTQLPASIFSALFCLFVLVFAPLITWLWVKLETFGIRISAPVKLVAGIQLAAAGIVVFAFASMEHATGILIGILAGNALLSAGELVLTPVVYTMMSDVAPTGMKSTMMGCWFLFVALGGYLSSLLASLSHRVAVRFPLAPSEYFTEFVFIALFTFLISLMLLIFIPTLKRMLA